MTYQQWIQHAQRLPLCTRVWLRSDLWDDLVRALEREERRNPYLLMNVNLMGEGIRIRGRRFLPPRSRRRVIITT